MARVGDAYRASRYSYHVLGTNFHIWDDRRNPIASSAAGTPAHVHPPRYYYHRLRQVTTRFLLAFLTTSTHLRISGRSFLLEYGTSSSSRRFVHSNLNGSCEETNYNDIEPRESPKPQPLGNGPFVILFTTCTLCAIFILWRRASMIRAVVGHRYGYYYVTAHLCIKPAFSVLKIGQERGKVPSVYPSMMAPLHMNFCKTITTKTTRT